MGLSSAEKQRRHRDKIAAQRAAMDRIPCACGCGTMIPPITAQGKPARYAHGHNHDGKGTRFRPGHAAWNKGKPYPCASEVHKGKKLRAEEIARRTETRRDRNGGEYVRPGFSPTERRDRNEWYAQTVAATRARDVTGERNPFYGRTHTEETRRRISEHNNGPGHPNWHNGASTLPYGPEFTRKFKRLIRERDSNTCQRCGKTREENDRTMQIHHIDHDKSNNDPMNLVTVCNSCNVWCSYHRDEPFKRLKR